MLAVVAEQTGYPEDMLDLDLDLEADLGIDTVKQAEVFAAIREQYGIERDDTLKLRDYPTLTPRRRVRPRPRRRLAAGPPRPRPRLPPRPPASRTGGRDRSGRGRRRVGDDVAAAVLAVVAEQTGYPPDLLDLDLDLEADLGIDTVKQAEVFAAIREQYGIERDDTLKLRDYPTLAHVVGFVHDRADLHPPAPPRTRPSCGAPGSRAGGRDRPAAGADTPLPAPRPGPGAPAPARRLRADRRPARRRAPASC